MNLYTQAATHLQSVLAQYLTNLSAVRGYLDSAVQEAGGYWEKPNTDLRLLDPCTRGGHIRALAGALALTVRTDISIPDDED